MGGALARLGVQVGSNPKAATAATARSDGALFLNCAPSGEEMWDNASLNEELWHLVNLLTLKANGSSKASQGISASFRMPAPRRSLTS